MDRKRFLYVLIVSLALIALPYARATAQGTLIDEEPESGAVVCAPDVYESPPGDCLPLGPSAYITEMAKLGLTFPQRALPAYKPNPALTQLPYLYFKLDDDIVPILSAPDDNSATGQSFQPGFVYVSYVNRVESNGVFYMLQNGGWIPGKGSRIGEYSRFQGLQFKKTPPNAFAWPLPFYTNNIPVYRAPSYSALLTDRVIYPYAEVVEVYATQSGDGVDWNMIGPDQWVEARIFAMVTPNPTPPEGVTTSRWIDVDLAEQTLSVYDNNQLVFATVIATGLEPFWTRPGLFQIYQKKETETMRNNDPTDYYYLDNVPWTMYFDKARALHGAYWRTRFGYPQSHGCVNLSVGDAHWLFNWAHEGDYVYVHDPTGQTPTDPALYRDWAY
ncbi:MAG TPA: L,D-transpeptidase [Anaerolineales bacterium]|nr:L,D-transpeptidase [Anaerolineales bacterium]HLO29210.1 L,D-transpeptidase [Anaerolineales bacterium]